MNYVIDNRAYPIDILHQQATTTNVIQSYSCNLLFCTLLLPVIDDIYIEFIVAASVDWWLYHVLDGESEISVIRNYAGRLRGFSAGKRGFMSFNVSPKY